MLMKDAMDGGAGDSITLRQLAQALTLAAIAQDPDAIKVEWFAANVPALELGATHAGAHSFDDEVAFEFRNGADDDNDGSTQRTAGIELFAITYKLDIEMIEFIQHFQKVFD